MRTKLDLYVLLVYCYYTFGYCLFTIDLIEIDLSYQSRQKLYENVIFEFKYILSKKFFVLYL